MEPDRPESTFYETVIHGQTVVVERVAPGRAKSSDNDRTVPFREPWKINPDPDDSRWQGRLEFDERGQQRLIDEIRHTRGSEASGWKK
jgi:hypothetical protein